MTKKRVLVTGGTGFTGGYLLRHLCEQGMEVHAIRRQSSDISAFADLPITWFVGNVYDEAVLREAMQGVQIVYHLAAAYRVTNLPDKEYVDVHLTSTQILGRLALEQADFERFVLVSTIGVMGHIDNPPADESAPYRPGDLYQSTKADAEKWFIEFGAQNNIDWTVVRPAAIYGPGDRRLLKLFKLAKLPIIPLIGWSRGLYHLIHVEDLSRFIIHSSLHADARGEIYICGDKETSSIKEVLQFITEKMGKKARFFRIPAAPIFLLSRIVDWTARKLNMEPFIYPRRIAFFTKDRAFDTRKMQSLGDFEYRYDKRSGVTELVDWYRNQGWL